MNQKIWCGVLVAVLLGPLAGAQVEMTEEDIDIDFLLNYGGAYRLESWVAVDVLITNPVESFEGYIEVATYGAGRYKIGNTYTRTVDCPKESKKRVRLYCYLPEGAARVEVNLLKDGRPLFDVPPYMPLTPITDEEDLVMVFDEQPSDYAFLYRAAGEGSDSKALHRVSVTADNVTRPFEYPSCYDPFSAAILGNLGAVNPEDIPEKGRIALKAFVEAGGTLFITTGGHADLYRDSWVEDWAGVSIGRVTPASIIPEGPQVDVAQLTVEKPGMKVLGQDRILATKRPMAKGAIITLPIDTTNEATAELDTFLAIWSEGVTQGGQSRIHFANAAYGLGQSLMQLVGINIWPRAKVARYLIAYFLIGIVGNWFFWVMLKRKQYAWLTLVVVSLSFTGYAVATSIVENRRNNDLIEFELLDVTGGAQARRYSMQALTSPATRTFSATIQDEDALVRQVEGAGVSMGTRLGLSQMATISQDGAPVIDDLRVAARDFSYLAEESLYPIQGGISGKLTMDDQGLHGQLYNHTGLPLSEFVLFINGEYIQLDGLKIDMSLPEVQRRKRQSDFLTYGHFGARRYAQSEAYLASMFAHTAFLGGSTDYNRYAGIQVKPSSSSWSPKVFAMTGKLDKGRLALDSPADITQSSVVVVADLAVSGDSVHPGWLPLLLSDPRNQFQTAMTIDDALKAGLIFSPQQQRAFNLAIGQDRYGAVAQQKGDSYHIEVDIAWPAEFDVIPTATARLSPRSEAIPLTLQRTAPLRWGEYNLTVATFELDEPYEFLSYGNVAIQFEMEHPQANTLQWAAAARLVIKPNEKHVAAPPWRTPTQAEQNVTTEEM